MRIMNLREDEDSLPVLARWHQDEWHFLEPTGTLRDRIRKMKRCFCNAFVPSIYIAKEKNALLGSAAIVEHDMDTRTDLTPWLAGVYVSENHRKRGIGARLVRYVMQQAGAHGFETLYLYTPTQRVFYQKLGWTTVEEIEYKGCPVTIMSAGLQNKLEF